MAVYSLPPEMLGFFKENIDYVTDNAVNPDQRRYAVVGEAPRHFIDLDDYSDSVQVILPKLNWNQAVEKFTEDSLMAHGIVPWQIQKMTYQLTQAFVKKSNRDILRIATDLGHYIADSNVPLHTTSNYNGQKTNQVGIHGFWESRLPELYSKDYDLFIGKAEYENNIQKRSWKSVLNANAALDSVLKFERFLTEKMDEEKKFTIEERNGITVRAYSRNFSSEYHKMLDNQVERQMKASIKMISDIWFTAWVDAGQPDLKAIPKLEIDPKEEQDVMKSWLQRLLDVRKESDN
ncbi:zinc dependent phospholipase C family protein [Lacihabitans sp. LS3-19]|uniref:zinc dependent phospholipase C family protein n=1 Tax=Lacihabitans sp. LS3-19 TaxID=2487335 RepID=UPI00286E211F|nr:zinc dependent phospholipase C family protein [Lacihabitans sp. LS3-19]